MSRRQRKEPFSLLSFQDIITSVSGIVLLITLLLAIELIGRSLGQAQPVVIPVPVDVLKHESEVMQSDIAALESQAARNEDLTRQTVTQSVEQLDADLLTTMANIQRIESELRTLEKQHQERSEIVSEQLESLEQRSSDLGERIQAEQAEAEELGAKLAEIESGQQVFFQAARDNAGEMPWLVDVRGSHIEVMPLEGGHPPLAFRRDNGGTLHRNEWAEFDDWLDAHDATKEYVILLVRPSGLDNYLELRDLIEDARFKLGLDVIAEGQEVSVQQ